MKLVVDENVPLADELFGAHADLVRCAGRMISKETLEGAQALIVRSVTPVIESLIANTTVEFVGSCTAGTDHIDTAFLNNTGIDWCYAPGCNARSVTEYVTSALAALNKLEFGKRAGVVGCGNVGKAVYDELSKLGMDVVAYDPFLDHGKESRTLSTLDDALASDIVCLHTPYTDSGRFPTNAMIGEAQLRLMKSGAILISAGRGAVLDEKAMHLVAQERPDVRWVLDVWDKEPCIDTNSLKTAVIATPHVAGYSIEGKQNGSQQVYQRFCEHFGIAWDPRDSRDLGLDQATLPKYDSINDMLLKIYDPRVDTETVKRAFMEATVAEKDSGSWFDELRRSYPSRRERSAYVFDGCGGSQALREKVEDLGFVFVEEGDPRSNTIT